MARFEFSMLIALAILLASCGGGSHPMQQPPPAPQAYLPLSLGNTWNYDCGGGVTITDTVTQQVTVNGQATFALQLEFPNAATQIFLLANDAQANTTLYGFLVNGAPVSVTPALYISSNPKQNEMFNYSLPDGSTVDRMFVLFENTNPTALGVFQVASYNDNGTQDIWGYALGKGIMEQDHGSFDCKITSYTLH